MKGNGISLNRVGEKKGSKRLKMVDVVKRDVYKLVKEWIWDSNGVRNLSERKITMVIKIISSPCT